ncbi:MAG: hypothetical protein HQ579_07140, partial [Candidatus Omnitrophica bacterium]|nr:hypothetical protein [Candidatus Omnitrophota bacterium]
TMIATFAVAEPSLNATGSDWLKLSAEEKYALMDEIYTTLKLDKNEYPVERGAEVLNGMYLNTVITATVDDMNITLDTPCLKAVRIGLNYSQDEFKKQKE